MQPRIRPIISVLICSNKDSNLLVRSVRSAQAQTFQNIEIVIVFNGDSSLDLLRRYKMVFEHDQRIRLLATQTHYLNFNLSFGVESCQGTYVARLDDDDFMMPNRLEAQYNLMEKSPRITVLGSNYYKTNNLGKHCGEIVMPESNEAIRRSLYFKNPICHPTVMFRKVTVQKHGGYLGGNYAEDYDLWTRMSMDPSTCFYNIQECLLAYNFEINGSARRNRQAYANMAATQLRNFLLLGDPRWLLGCLLTSSKRWLRSR